MPSAQPVLHRDISALYDAHHNWLQSWLRRRLGNAWEAADLAQDTFLRLLSVPNSSDAPTLACGELREPRAYLATVARRLMINHLRRQSLEQAWLAALAALPEPQTPSLEQQYAIIQALQQIDAILDDLPAKVRSVFILSQIEGLTYAEIATQLHIGLRSVKRYMAQAMAEYILLAD